MTVYLIFSRPTFVSCYLPEIWEYHSAARWQQLRKLPSLALQTGQLRSDTAAVKTWHTRDGSGSISSETSGLPPPSSGHSGQEMHLRRFDKIFLFPRTLIHKIFSYCFILVTKYFADSLIFAETCTADCPQFLEDRQKLGELRSVKRKINIKLWLNWSEVQ